VPLVSGGGFSGGVVAGRTIVAPSAPANPAFGVTAPIGQDAAGDDIIEVKYENGTTLFYIDGSGSFYSKLLSGQSFSILDAAGHIVLGLTTTGVFSLRDGTSNAYVFRSNVDGAGGILTAPPVSAASTLALGTAYQNALNYDVLLLVCLNVTVNTSGVLKLGVGPTSTPTQQNIVSGVTTTGQWFIPIYLPSSYYALLSTTGTITVAIDGQIAMPV